MTCLFFSLSFLCVEVVFPKGWQMLHWTGVFVLNAFDMTIYCKSKENNHFDVSTSSSFVQVLI